MGLSLQACHAKGVTWMQSGTPVGRVQKDCINLSLLLHIGFEVPVN